MEREKPRGMRIGESVFCVGYLLFAFVAALVFLLAASRAGAWAMVSGVMTLLLGAGDAFHLVPRVLANVRGETSDPFERKRRAFWLGLGNLVSSVTMTVFYLLLFVVMRDRAYPQTTIADAQVPVLVALVVLAVVRVTLCLFPQNRWFDGVGSQRWGIYRDGPFAAMGAVTVWYLVAWYGEWLMAALVLVSFACYLGVVLGARRRPMLGMLMIPKTICYIWLIALLLSRL